MFSATSNRLPQTLLFLLCLTIGTTVGCRRSEAPPAAASDGPCAGFPETYGTLRYLRQSTHPDLKAEYALLVEKEHTPCQLVQQDKTPDQNMVVAIQKAIHADQAEEIIKKTDFLIQRDRFEFNPLQLKKIKSLTEDYDYTYGRLAEAMALPNCTFGYDHTQGLMADDSFVEQLLAASRLQVVAAANDLFNTRNAPTPASEKEEPNEKSETPPAGDDQQVNPSLRQVLDHIQTIFKLANQLGQVQQVRARLTAESIREEACFILESLVHDPRCNKATLLQLQKIMQGELAHWNRDAEMWIGDRALGLYLYEAVRDGLILSILSEEEKEAFRQEGTLDYLTDTTMETADEDELYYLKTMRNLIDSCDRDFYKRPLLGSKIIEELQSQKDSPNYPIVAAKVLLGQVDTALMIQMADLARIRAWSVALDVAMDMTPEANINPINGEPYLITKTDKAVTVRAIPKDDPTEINSPLDEASKQFIARELQRPVVIPLSAARE